DETHRPGKPDNFRIESVQSVQMNTSSATAGQYPPATPSLHHPKTRGCLAGIDESYGRRF
ncbi:MAG: hypothetical protein ACKOAY_07540, partial [Haliscomenobacter sp.]